MKDVLCEIDERKVADIIRKAMPNLTFGVSENPKTEICRVFIGGTLIHEVDPDELDDPDNIPRFIDELRERLRRFNSRKR